MISARSPGLVTATGGGLLGALIDSSVQKSRQSDMAGEIRATLGPLVQFDLRQEANAALQAAAAAPDSGSIPFGIRSAQVMAAAPSKAENERLVAGTRDNSALLMLLVQYALEPGLGAFTTRTSAVLRQEGNTEPTYQMAAIYQVPLPPGPRDAVLKQLTADDGQLLRAYMRESVSETLRMVALDLATPAGADRAPAGSLPVHRFNSHGNVVDLPAATIAMANTRTVVRNETGALFSLQKESK